MIQYIFKYLENEFLSTYPVTKQNNKYIVEKIQSEAKVFIELKNSGINRYNLLKKIDYKKIRYNKQ